MSVIKEGITAEGADIVVREDFDYGRLWPDGTFQCMSDYSEKYGRKEFEEKSYELERVPAALRPVFGKRRKVTTVETHPAEAVTDEVDQ